MIANLLPNEATHSSLDLFEKPALLVTFDGSFCQKLGPVYRPDGPMLEFEVTGDRNNFIDLQKIFLEIKCKIVQSSGADLKYDDAATADTARTDAPYFCSNVLHSLFSDCTVSANGLKISNANANYAHKSFMETEFSHNKDVREHLVGMSRPFLRRRSICNKSSGNCLKKKFSQRACRMHFLW